LTFACETYCFKLEKLKDPITKRLKLKWLNNLIPIENIVEDENNDIMF